ncbi:MAG: cardiolipin synthase [Clostridia bacterium]|nr:cardiolipin synthase [Clostridia bacterium]
MKRKIKYNIHKKVVERDISYIPLRYIIAAIISLLEVIIVISAVAVLCYFVPYFYIAAYITQIFCVIKIISSDDNPDYKIPWLLFVLILPIAGFMLYFLFYSRKLKKKYIKRLKYLYDKSYKKDDKELLEELQKENLEATSQAKMILNISGAHLFRNTTQKYYPLGEEMFMDMLADLKRAEKFIFMEYFIIEEGKFWNSILEVLKEKAKNGIEIKVLYDDIGCMNTLPSAYYKKLRKLGIQAIPFSRLKGNADSEFNNRNHRKITVIDGVIGYTGGINIADEYINEIKRFGHWKDTGIRLEGDGVKELTKLFMIDYGLNIKEIVEERNNRYPQVEKNDNVYGYLIPFGDGPRPIYPRRVGKSVINNMIASANRYAYIMTPYLIIDNDLCQTIEDAALRGVDVRIVLPHIPDKKIVFTITKSFYDRLMKAGVKIYEYEKGFVHAKVYLVDDTYAMVGTINLDYRSLVHHFENGVWMYKTDCIKDIKKDFDETIGKSMRVTDEMKKARIGTKMLRAIVKIFAPLL